MKITEGALIFALMLSPGIIAFLIIDNLTVHKKTEIHHWVVYSLLLGFFSHLMAAGILKVIVLALNLDFTYTFLDSIVAGEAKTMDIFETLFSSFLAVLLGLFIARVINKRTFFDEIAAYEGSGKFLELDAWDFFIREQKPKNVTIRDFDKGFVYKGIMKASSDANERDGIVLCDVTVYKDGGEELYKTDVLYIPTSMNSLLVEIEKVVASE